MTVMLVDLAEYRTAHTLVAGFFKDKDKATLWMRTANPMLGDVSPNQMILLGRFEKLHRFITVALAENLPP